MSKKIAILFVVGILLFASFSSMASSARIGMLGGDSEKDTGTVVPYREKEEFIIEGDNGIVFLGKVFYKYLPLNLPEEFRKEGLKVKFTATISLKKIFTMDGLWHLIRGILPIELTSIENIRKLKVIAPPKIEEGKRFLVTVTDSTGEPVEKAMVTVSWLKCEKCVFYTNVNGSVELEAPLVEKDAKHFISAAKEGYVWSEKEIIILNKKPILDFDISLEKNTFRAGEPIIVKAILTNMGNSPIKVSSFVNDHFDVTDSNGEELDYVGPIGALPYPVILKPGGYISKTVDINKCYAYRGPDFDPADHQLPPGEYKIIGHYSSGPAHFPPDVNWTDVWEGNLRSPVYKFTVQSPVYLDFDISLEKNTFRAGEPIIVKATITNKYKIPVKVSEILLAGGSLKLDIITPHGDILKYYGPMITGWPEVIDLKPGMSTSERVDIASGNFARNIEEKQNGGFSFEKNPGIYTIKAAYSACYPTDSSQTPSPIQLIPKDLQQPFIDEEGRWHGILHLDAQFSVVILH